MRKNQAAILSLRIGTFLRSVFKHQAQDGVAGDLAAEGLEGGEDFVARGCFGASGEEHSVGELREDEGVGVDGGRAVEDDEAEFLAPADEQIGHTDGRDELGGTGRTRAGGNDGEQWRRGDGVMAGGRIVARENVAEAGCDGAGSGSGSGAQVGIDAEDGGAMLGEDGGEVEGEGGRRVFRVFGRN